MPPYEIKISFHLEVESCTELERNLLSGCSFCLNFWKLKLILHSRTRLDLVTRRVT